MGGDRHYIEFDRIEEDFKSNPIVMSICKDGDILPFMECIIGHEEIVLV